LGDHIVGSLELLVLAQQLRFGQQLGARVGWGAVGQGAQQLARLVHLALLSQDRCTALLRGKEVLWILDLVQPSASQGIVLALFRDARQRKVGLGQAAAALFA